MFNAVIYFSFFWVFLVGLIGLSPNAYAKQCSEKKLKEILQPASKKRHSVKVNCSVKLPKKSQVTKRLLFQGKSASDIVFDCNGSTIDARKGALGANKDIILIRSLKKKDKQKEEKWSKPENITIENCNIFGSVRIYGMSQNGEGKKVRASSLSRGHTARAQSAAPTQVTLKRLTIVGLGRIPLYLSPGVTHVELLNSSLKGVSKSTAIYLDAESGHNQIRNNFISVDTRREQIAIDGSANNIIRGNRFSGLESGGVFLYRNCGEGGTIRHQPPQNNEVSNNGFYYNKFIGYNLSNLIFGHIESPAIWVGSRNGYSTYRIYCPQDRGYSFGSSINNDDFARGNTIANNQIVKLDAKSMIKISDRENRVYGNRTVKKITLRPEPVNKKKEKPDRRLSRIRNENTRSKVINFDCIASDNNRGCHKLARCPIGKSVTSISADCNLEAPGLDPKELPSLEQSKLLVVRSSDRLRHSYCAIGSIAINRGNTDLRLIRGVNDFEIGCRKYDRNGGDCAIRGQMICK